MGAALLAAPMLVFSADGKKPPAPPEPPAAPKPAPDAEATHPDGPTLDALKDSLLRGLRPENLPPRELESLREEMRTQFGPEKQLKDLSAPEMIRLLDRTLVKIGESDPPPRPAPRPSRDRTDNGNGAGMRPEFDRRLRGGAPPPGGRRGGFRGGSGRPGQPFAPEPFPDTGQFVSPFGQALFEEESGQDPEITIRSYLAMIARFNRVRENMAITHYRLGQYYEKIADRDNAAHQYRKVLSHFSDFEAVKTDCETALKELEGKTEDRSAASRK